MALLDKIPVKGRVYRFRKLLFWAQGGCVCIEDADNEGEFIVKKAEEFAALVVLFNQTLKHDAYAYPYDRNEACDFVVNGCAAVKEARKQGDPFDPEVLAQKRRERENNKGYIFLGGAGGSFLDRALGVRTTTAANPRPKNYEVGPGNSVILRTNSQDDVPHLAKLLPTLPRGKDPK